MPPRMIQYVVNLDCSKDILTVGHVKVVNSKVNIRGGKVLGEVISFVVSVRVGAIRSDSQAHALCITSQNRSTVLVISKTHTFTGGDHVVGIERLDVGRSLGYPVGDDIGVATLAARLVAQLPRKDSRGILVARDDSLDIRLVHALDLLIGVPFRLGASIGSNIGFHATIVIPVIHKGNDQLNAVLLGGGDNVIKTLQTISAGVDGGSTGSLVVELEIDSSRAGDAVNVIETPGSKNLQTSLFQTLEDGVNIRIVGQEWQPIRVCASEVLGHAVNIELETIHLGKGAAASGLRRGSRGRRS